jgi:hypothetical protein
MPSSSAREKRRARPRRPAKAHAIQARRTGIPLAHAGRPPRTGTRRPPPDPLLRRARPAEGLYHLHAGEAVTPAGRGSGRDGRSIGDVHVKVALEGDLDGLGKFIKVKAVEATPEISHKIGRLADTKRRTGNF